MLAKSLTKWLKMRLLLLLVLAFINAIKSELGRYTPYDYCDPNLKLCSIPRSHTMCRYPVPGLSQDCMPFISTPLTPAEKLQVLSLHNKLRSRVATGDEKTNLGTLPAASNMRQIRWDEELEIIADRWASRCFNVTVTKVHDDCRNTKRFRVTQNIGTIGSKSISVEKKVVQIFYQWYIKSKSFNPRIISAYVDDINKTNEEFGSLIWADTYALGCASVMFQSNLTDSQDGDTATPWTFERIVCNYGPGGNIPGKPVYKIGIPCSQCPAGWICSDEYDGLCVLSDSSRAVTKKPSNRSFDIIARKMSLVTFNGMNSTNRYYGGTTRPGSHAWSSSPVHNESDKNSFKLKVGVYYNGECHCPDITRYGFDGSRKIPANMTAKLEKLKSLIIRSVGDIMRQTNIGKALLGLKNGDRCYCKTNIPNAGVRYNPPTPYLTFFIIPFLIN